MFGVIDVVKLALLDQNSDLQPGAEKHSTVKIKGEQRWLLPPVNVERG